MQFRETLAQKLDELVAGVRTRFLRLGQGPPLLAMPGLLGRDASPAAEASSQHYEVVAPHPPGFWESQTPQEQVDIPWFGGKWLGGFHQAVIGLRQIRALGFSAGGTILIRFAATHPGAVERMVLHEPIIRGSDLQGWLRLLMRITAVPGAAAVILKIAPNLVPTLPGLRQVGWRKRFRLVQGVNSPRVAGELARSLRTWDATDELLSLGIPVLIIHGDRGRLVPVEAFTSLQGPNISLLEIPGLDHFLGGVGQVEVVEAARDFLTSPRIL